MKHLQDRTLRERLYRAHIARASRGKWDNKVIILKILQMRKKIAQIFGKRSWAEYALEQRMAPNVQAVTDLHEDLRGRAYPVAQKELSQLQSFAENEYGLHGPLQHWDIPFFSERMREKLFGFSSEELRSYFPFPAVLKGLFDLSTRLFGIKIVAAPGEAEVWHPDVQFFKVFDASSEQHIASFFLDPYSRDDKLGGTWMSECVGRSTVMNTKPVAYMSLETTPPIGNAPALMTFDEMKGLFHEFGHALQHMLTTVEDASAAGTNGIEFDAIELPSKFMENWCYDEKTVMGFARHQKTGEPLPKELWTKLKDSKNFHVSMSMLEELFSSQLDMVLHDTFDPDDGASSLSKLEDQIAEQYAVVKPLEEDLYMCRFHHIFSAPYDVGYYSYKWSEILSADCFAAFEEAGLNNDEEVRRIGRKFRDTVLSMGGSKHASEIFKAFRGRDPSPEALLRHSGLTQVASASP
jgi:oligopeptidase A